MEIVSTIHEYVYAKSFHQCLSINGFFFWLSTISAHYLCLTLNSNNLKWYVSVECALFPFDIIKIKNNMIYCCALHIFIVVFLDFCDFRWRISVSLGLFILFFFILSLFLLNRCHMQMVNCVHLSVNIYTHSKSHVTKTFECLQYSLEITILSSV